MEKDGACKMDRENKKNAVVVERVGEGKTAGTDNNEEKKLARPLAKKELPDEGCSRTGVYNPRAAGHLRPSSEFSVAREGYFTKYNALLILKLESLDTARKRKSV